MLASREHRASTTVRVGDVERAAQRRERRGIDGAELDQQRFPVVGVGDGMVAAQLDEAFVEGLGEHVQLFVDAKVEIDVKYVGYDIPNEFVIGYGLDYAERYRDLPYIATLKPEVYA